MPSVTIADEMTERRSLKGAGMTRYQIHRGVQDVVPFFILFSIHVSSNWVNGFLDSGMHVVSFSKGTTTTGLRVETDQLSRDRTYTYQDWTSV